MEDQKDPKLWRMAKRRASFQQNLYSYIAVNIILWVIWWFTNGRYGNNNKWPWPLWLMIFWGIGVFFDYLKAYSGGDKESLAEQEYEKLKKEKEKPGS